MKTFALLALLFTTPAFAVLEGAPFLPEVDARFNKQEGTYSQKFVYDVAVKGGSSTAAKPLGVFLPAGAKIFKMKLFVNTQFTDSGTGSLALECGGTRNLLGYTDITALSANDMLLASVQEAAPISGALLGPPVTARTNYIAPTAACEVTAVVRGDSGYVPLLGGKLSGYIDYLLE
jgi:hypothetical protein